ncbi:hypothetical protein L1049_000771 [Liquidambar formosana]|uniref:Uncharacterized protein n=1 Tax=Liquidambar formosana TaxID=63359 RepID=A0AAP0NAB5_LIQFO
MTVPYAKLFKGATGFPLQSSGMLKDLWFGWGLGVFIWVIGCFVLVFGSWLMLFVCIPVVVCVSFVCWVLGILCDVLASFQKKKENKNEELILTFKNLNIQ